ncbi:probable E3 ubiquitin-protein ligase HERC3, partial [Clupea harengus]|uniref:Probable E3 ubiquitin-protein ligase HERC3 n=1 Tax=Clupea harengus TaxID=7950 RepID=A0A6P8FLS4_CLUHA
SDIRCGTGGCPRSSNQRPLYWRTSDRDPEGKRKCISGCEIKQSKESIVGTKGPANFQNRQIVQIACGDHHSVALTKDGQLFTWGQNSNGQLGLGKGESSTSSPRPLKSLVGIPLSQISAGGDHSFALSLSGAVFGWGKNSAGQLGLGDDTDRLSPAPVVSLHQKKTVFISCGAEHTAVLTKGGLVFTCGSGRYGQLGHNSLRDELRPRLVAEFWGSKVSQIACGRYHTLGFVESQSILYAFGCGEQGQLGSGRTNNQTVPLPVDLPQEQNNDSTIKIIFAGANQSFAVSRSGENWVASHPNCDQRKKACELDLEIADRWISSNPKHWTRTKRNITKIFSSVSCINGSFLKKSSDKHYSTSQHQCGLDLSMTRQFFEKLSRKEKVLKEVESVVQQHLLPSLNHCPAGVEALRVYLILPELLRVLLKQQLGTYLAVSLAEAILKLCPDLLKVLEGWWGSMGKTMMSKHIQVWKNALSFLLRAGLLHHYNPGVKATLEVLKCLHRANRKAEMSKQVHFTDFYIKELSQNSIMLQTDVTLWRQIKSSQLQEVELTPAIFCRFPFLLDLPSKVLIYQHDAQVTKVSHQLIHHQAFTGRVGPNVFPGEVPTPVIKLNIRRTHLLEDTFRQLGATDHENFQKQLVVQFVDETKLTLVQAKDFFLHTFDDLFAPDFGMFMYDDTKTLVWFPSKPKHETKTYFLFGILCGLALNNNNIVHLPFPQAMFKKLLGVKVTLEDLTEFSSVLGESLRYILYDYTDDDIENLDMTYSITWDDTETELDPKEMGKPVTSKNKKEFVQAYVNYALNKSVERVFEEFKRGFFKVCARDVVEMFHPEELRGMMVGREDYDWDKLKQNTVYESGYHGNHPVIKIFWEVFDELSHDQKKAFLLFLTGCGRVPILGMDQIRMTIRAWHESSQDHFPQSLTCHAILDLPMYQSKERLQTLLTEALNHNRGFWKE